MFVKRSLLVRGSGPRGVREPSFTITVDIKTPAAHNVWRRRTYEANLTKENGAHDTSRSVPDASKYDQCIVHKGLRAIDAGGGHNKCQHMADFPENGTTILAACASDLLGAILQASSP